MTTKHFIVCFLIYIVGTAANPGVIHELEDIGNKISKGFQQAETEIVKEFHKLEHAIEEHPDIFDDVKHELEDVGKKISEGFQDSKTAVVDEYQKVERAIEEKFKAVKRVILNACACTRYSCGCCAHLEEAQIELNATICTNITYLVHDYGISFTVTVNGFAIFNETVSARNPPPVCLGMPYVKELADVCVRLYDINATTTYLHACVRIEARLKMILIAKYDVGCFNLGPPGISFDGINVVDNVMNDFNRVVEASAAPNVLVRDGINVVDNVMNHFNRVVEASAAPNLLVREAHLGYDHTVEAIQTSNTSSGLVIPIVASLGVIILIIAITVVVYFIINKKREDERRATLQSMKRYGSTSYMVPQTDPYC